jgi:hypothetical protein
LGIQEPHWHGQPFKHHTFRRPPIHWPMLCSHGHGAQGDVLYPDTVSNRPTSQRRRRRLRGVTRCCKAYNRSSRIPVPADAYRFHEERYPVSSSHQAYMHSFGVTRTRSRGLQPGCPWPIPRRATLDKRGEQATDRLPDAHGSTVVARYLSNMELPDSTDKCGRLASAHVENHPCQHSS